MIKRLPTYFMYLMICGFAALLIAGCCHPRASESLAVTVHPQETSMWCWAASGQMVMDYLGHNVSQCVQANNRFGRTDCCNSPVPNGMKCIKGGWPEFGKYNFEFKTTSNAPLSWDDLMEQISTEKHCGKKPFCFTWHHSGGGGHMMVAIGYTTVGGTNYVEMLDPWPPNVGDHRFITYDTYVSPPNKTHWDDYYNIKYIGGE